MLLSMWNIYKVLDTPHKRPFILDNSATIRYARLYVRDDLRSNTVYVASAEALHYRSPNSTVIVHDNDAIFVEGMSVSEVFNAVATVIDRYNYWEHQLQEATFLANGVDRILELAQRYLPGSYYAYTYSGKALGLYCERQSRNGTEWNTVAKTADLSYDRLNAVNAIVDFTHIVPGSHQITELSKSGSFHYTYSGMTEHGENIGYLIYSWDFDAIPRGASVILDMIENVLIRYCKNHVSTLNWIAKSASFFGQLCEGKNPTNEMKDYFKSIGWSFKDTFQVLSVFCGETDRNYRLTSFIKRVRSLFHFPIFCFHKDEYLMILLNLIHEPEHAAKVRELTSSMDRDFFCGVSSPYSSLAVTGYYCNQAVMEYKRATNINRPASFGNEHGFEHYCDTFGSDIGEACYVSRSLATLANYDISNTTELYATMRAYILSGFHVGDAARLANVHRNTFQYRLNQISEIIDISEFEILTQTPDINKLQYYQLSLFLIDCGLRRRHDRLRNSLNPNENAES